DFPVSTAADSGAVLGTTGDDQNKRRAKSASYDRQNSLPIKEEPGIWPVNLSSHWWLHLPALPVTQSDAIAVGAITGNKAFLSNDKHAVYSEFSLQVEQVLKDGTQSINPGAVITTTRFGGIVRFPSGTKYVYRLSRQSWPATGSRYVLFLRKNQSGDFDIVTGYEFRDGVAKPLDGTDLPGALPFQKYAGTLESVLLGAIKHAVASSTAGEHNL
ncbi:MAG TPA: hypothetical protein VNB54_03265, partial [Alphaproteobacteria bacterium]|nr:hypothetical protein [Alphaproteobacteria bacterium]